uniref:RNase III domain-containing protein n=1 Tax=Ascaris lumbricoides TaxID=6252 RepID=A0A0M3ISW9_ASCLU
LIASQETHLPLSQTFSFHHRICISNRLNDALRQLYHANLSNLKVKYWSRPNFFNIINKSTYSIVDSENLCKHNKDLQLESMYFAIFFLHDANFAKEILDVLSLIAGQLNHFTVFWMFYCCSIAIIFL